MAVWEDTQLLLRGQDLRQMLALGHRVDRVSHPGGAYRRFDPDSQTCWPLADLAAAAQVRRQASRGKAEQVLILYDAAERAGIIELRKRLLLEHAHVTAVAVDVLGDLGHADLVQAIASGFDWVLIGAQKERESKQAQLSELALARCFGIEDRAELFRSTTHLEHILLRVVGTRAPLFRNAGATVAPGSGTRRHDGLRQFAGKMGLETDQIPLPDNAPYGTLKLDATRCEHCKACTWICPTQALKLEDADVGLVLAEPDCVQCGLCVSICESDALSLSPRLRLVGADTPQQLEEGGLAAATAFTAGLGWLAGDDRGQEDDDDGDSDGGAEAEASPQWLGDGPHRRSGHAGFAGVGRFVQHILQEAVIRLGLPSAAIAGRAVRRSARFCALFTL